MNKQELIDAIAAKTNGTKTEAGANLSAFIDVVTEILAKGGDIQLVGFGTFSVGDRAAREGRNPKTGETIQISAAKVPKFSAGAKLKAACN